MAWMLGFLVVRDVRNLFARVLSGRGRSFRQMPNLRAGWRHCEPKSTPEVQNQSHLQSRGGLS
jgi:hypothetical protein